MNNGEAFSPPNDEQRSNKVGVELRASQENSCLPECLDSAVGSILGFLKKCTKLEPLLGKLFERFIFVVIK